ncbi:MAG: hypothetical protein RLZ98_290 [Pseudomonadota bacterium]
MAEGLNAALLSGLPPKLQTATGRGIAIAYLDYGFDLLHPALLDPNRQRTRFSYLWDQCSEAWPAAETSAVPGSITDLDAGQLDMLICDARNAFSRAPVERVYDAHGNRHLPLETIAAARGTIIASVSAGSRVSDFRGVAPEAQLIAVHLGLEPGHWREAHAGRHPLWAQWEHDKVPTWDRWRSFDEAPQLMAGLDYAYDRATALQSDGLVICLADGGWPGAHDGTSALEGKIAEIIERGKTGDGPPCIIVGGAGFNNGTSRTLRTYLPPNRETCLAWNIDTKLKSHIKLQIFFDPADDLSVQLALMDPNSGRAHNSVAARFDARAGRTVPISLGRRLAGIMSRGNGGSKRSITIAFYPPHFPHSIAKDEDRRTKWLITLRPESCKSTVPIHLALDDCGETALSGEQSENGNRVVLQPVAGAHGTILAGPAHTASPGPLLTIPDAPIWGARSKTSEWIQTDDNNGATGFVAGAVALALERAVAAGVREIIPEEIVAGILTCEETSIPAPAGTAYEATAVRKRQRRNKV